MKNLIEEIWYEYEMERCAILTKEKLKFERRISELLENLESNLDADKISLFQEYVEEKNKYQCYTEKETFIAGVRFGVNFILDIMIL